MLESESTFYLFEGGSSRLPGYLPGNRKVPAWSGLSSTVVSLGKKLHFICLSHPAVKPDILCNMHRAQLKNSLRLMLSSLLSKKYFVHFENHVILAWEAK